jgi:transposase
MIPIASGLRVWIATGHTDMRAGMNSLALLVQEAFKCDRHGSDLYVFHGKSGKLIKILWHYGIGMSLYAKRLERGQFIWPSSADSVVTITPAQLGYMYSRDRAGIHPEQHLAGYFGILQADAYSGFNALYKSQRAAGPITEALCWSHGRRHFFELADVASNARKEKPTTISPFALEAVKKIDAIFMAERSIND